MCLTWPKPVVMVFTTVNRADLGFVGRMRGNDVRNWWMCSCRDGMVLYTRNRHACILRNTIAAVSFVSTCENKRVFYDVRWSHTKKYALLALTKTILCRGGPIYDDCWRITRTCVYKWLSIASIWHNEIKTFTHVGLRRGTVSAANGKCVHGENGGHKRRSGRTRRLRRAFDSTLRTVDHDF